MTETTTRPGPGEANMHVSDGPHGLNFVQVDFLVGEVESFNHIQTHASGGGTAPIINGYGGGSQPINISSSSTNLHRFFVPTPNSLQHAITLNAAEFPTARGHWGSTLWATKSGNLQEGTLIFFRNRDTGAEARMNKASGDLWNMVTIKPFWRSARRTFATLLVVSGILTALYFWEAITNQRPSETMQDIAEIGIVGFVLFTVISAIATPSWAMIRSGWIKNNEIEKVIRSARTAYR